MSENTNSAKETLNDFAKTYEELIGSEETIILLKFLTHFAKTNPVVCLELRQEVLNDPETFIDMVHPESIMKFKSIISAVKSGGITALMSELM